MKTADIYVSQTGFTKRYAQWIGAAVDGPYLPLKEAKHMDFSSYDAIVFGSWLRAEQICKLSWFQRRLEQWADKTLILFCTGASPAESPTIAPMLQKLQNQSLQGKAAVFYCPGGMNYEKMSPFSRWMMQQFVKLLGKKKDKTDMDKAMLSMLSRSYDLTDQSAIEPIVSRLS